MLGINKLTSAIEALTVQVKRIADSLTRPPNPIGPFRARLISEGNHMLIYEFDLPQLPAGNHPDVTHGRVALTFNGEVQPEVKTEIGQAVLSPVKIEQGTNVAGDFAFVDDAGNPSANPTELTPFTASDTIPPPDAVGGFGARMVGEE